MATKTVIGWGGLRRVCIIPGRLDKKVAVITGANTGIGAVTAAELARRGCKVIMACRSLERAEEARKRILKKYGISNPDWLKTNIADESLAASFSPVSEDQLIIKKLDLASYKSIRKFAECFKKNQPRLNYLINNAGVYPSKYTTTDDGNELAMGVNHLGHFLLTSLLLHKLENSAPSRIIIVSSISHLWGQLCKPGLNMTEGNFVMRDAYKQSKLANALHACELSERLGGTGVVSVFLHPGVVRTEVFRHHTSPKQYLRYRLLSLVMINEWLGAQTTLYTVMAKTLVPGGYYDNCKLAEPNKLVKDRAERQWLWDRSCELVGLPKT
ncbi:unnamed protein product [Calicophoron daubneyi]|uniref:Retinol dehydrogenase 12 n=1 Tax=Calicophoron daubneyi TaxID=300641 RepID=A0AAV2T5S4_CALDB